ncbi:uncharacterized protein METZ01_LOCUS206937, partial [marine metagenome]
MYVHLFKQKKEFYMIINYRSILFFSVFVMFAFQCEKNHNTISPNGFVYATLDTEPVEDSDDT